MLPELYIQLHVCLSDGRDGQNKYIQPKYWVLYIALLLIDLDLDEENTYHAVLDEMSKITYIQPKDLHQLLNIY